MAAVSQRQDHKDSRPGFQHHGDLGAVSLHAESDPMYLGLTIAYLGEAGLQRQLWAVLLLPLVLAYLNWMVIPVEEEKLRQVFGRRYEEYRRRVGWWL